MSEDPTRDETADGAATPPEANGAHGDHLGDPFREVVMLRARCSNLRHWCRTLLDDPAAAGVLSEPTVAELRTTPPEVTEPEGQVVVALLARGGNVPPTHPLAPATLDQTRLRASIPSLAAERERLRQVFFTLYDHLYPHDIPTEEDLLREMQQASEVSISELIAEFEREQEGAR